MATKVGSGRAVFSDFMQGWAEEEGIGLEYDFRKNQLGNITNNFNYELPIP